MASNDLVGLTERAAQNLKRMFREFESRFSNKLRAIEQQAMGQKGGYQPEPKVRFKNESDETVPAYGVMRITGSEKKKHLKIDKPDDSKQPLYLVNGPTDIGAGKFGFGRYLTSQAVSFQHQYVLYDSTDGTPAYGETWGPENDSWKLAKGKPGFTILGGNDTEATLTAAVQQRVAQKGRLIARLTEDLDRWTYPTAATPTDLIGREMDYGDPGVDDDAPALPSAAAEIYHVVDVEDDHKYQLLGTGTVYNTTPWKLYSQVSGASGNAFDMDLLCVTEHNGLYLVDRPMNWTPLASFESTALESGGSAIEWVDATAFMSAATNKACGEIAAANGSSAQLIDILAPGYRLYHMFITVYCEGTISTGTSPAEVILQGTGGGSGGTQDLRLVKTSFLQNATHTTFKQHLNSHGMAWLRKGSGLTFSLTNNNVSSFSSVTARLTIWPASI